MASASDAVWALDLGNSALKALHLAVAGDAVEVMAFDTIAHAKNLAEVSGAEREEIIALSFRQFAERYYVGKDDVVIAVPTQSSFTRFVTLPPVEPKKVPEIIQFEAIQQIPFDINEVVWDSQLMTEDNDAEKRVGLFAIKNEVVNAELARLDREDLQVSVVQMASMALYNYLSYDHPKWVASDSKPVVMLNIGAESTDLVVCSRSTVWQRSIMIGGNAFTRAIASAFKINFEKAEKLKRTAAASKYARQIFQAMRPVFTDLASEVQKSIGFYTSSNPNVRIVRLVAMGGATRLRGLLKYLQQSLQIPVERPDQFKKALLNEEVSAAKFHDSVSEFAVVYGLGIQALGYGRIESNLLPKSVARQMAWAAKFKYFVLAASILLIVSLMALGRSILDKRSYESPGSSSNRRDYANLITRAQNAVKKNKSERQQSSKFEDRIKQVLQAFQYRDVVPRVYQTLLNALPNAKNNPAQKALYEAFAAGDAQGVMKIPRPQRRQLFVTGIKLFYSEDLANATFDAPQNASANGAEGSGARRMPVHRMRTMYPDARGASANQGDEEKPAIGFVITIQGYSPYAKISALLDPIGVDNQPNKWGFVTRLQHLDDMVDGNSPFKLFDKTNTNDFSILTGPVTATNRTSQNKDIPTGIGEPLQSDQTGGLTGPETLVDPLTKEVISEDQATDQLDPMQRNRGSQPPGTVRDHWFILKFKLIWRNAPKPVETSSGNQPTYVE